MTTAWPPFVPVARTISQEDIDDYAARSGDFNPLHVDPAYAAAGPFGTVVAHGPIGLQTCFAALAGWLGTDALPARAEVDVAYRGPVRLGDVVTCRATSIAAHAGRVVLTLTAENQRGEEVVQALVSLPRAAVARCHPHLSPRRAPHGARSAGSRWGSAQGATRRAVRLAAFGPPEAMRWTEEPTPAAAPGDVVVAVEAIGVNFADTMVRRGEYRRDQPLTFTPGFEVAGRVLAGPVSGPPPGTPVAVFCEHGGGYADVVVAPADRVYPLPEGTDPAVAAGLFLQGATALHAVRRYGRVRAGDTVLVPAASGGLGGLVVQLCAGLGARVVALASTPEKREVARAHGAHVVLPSDPEDLPAAVRAATGGRGCDVVVDGVGGPLFPAALRALAMNGRYVVVGSASQAPAPLDARVLMPRGQTVSGFVLARVMEDDPAEPQAALDEVLALHAAGTLRPSITTVPAADVADVHRRIEARTLTGKVVLLP